MIDSLDIRQLAALAVLAKTSSVTITARELSVTHSAISHSLRNLEAQVGCRLFFKLGKKMMLTEAGEALLLHAERVLKEIRQARAALAELNRWGSRRLRLAVESIFPPSFLTSVLLRFREEFPQCSLLVQTCAAGQALNLLPARSVDLALGVKPTPNDSFEFQPLVTDRFHLVAPPAHPLAAKLSLSHADLTGLPGILLTGCGYSRDDLEKMLAHRGIRLDIAAEVDRLETVKAFVQQTATLALLPGWLIAAELKDRSLVSLPLPKKPIEQTWGLIHTRSHPLNHTEAAFWKFCGQQIAAAL